MIAEKASRLAIILPQQQRRAPVSRDGLLTNVPLRPAVYVSAPRGRAPMASVNRDEEQRWVPTHVQVLVIRARGLRAKGKHGTSDAYALVQLGKEKYSTCVMEKSTEPEWGEECTFELQSGVLDIAGRDGHPASACDLTLTVMHRALIGLDVFLGQTVISLDKAFRERVCMRNE